MECKTLQQVQATSLLPGHHLSYITAIGGNGAYHFEQAFKMIFDLYAYECTKHIFQSISGNIACVLFNLEIESILIK